VYQLLRATDSWAALEDAFGSWQAAMEALVRIEVLVCALPHSKEVRQSD
jgi:hypothetical protein